MRPESKQFMLIESGVRIHSTDFAREKSKIPSGFSLKVCEDSCVLVVARDNV